MSLTSQFLPCQRFLAAFITQECCLTFHSCTYCIADPEEFLNILFHHILRVDPLLKLRYVFVAFWKLYLPLGFLQCIKAKKRHMIYQSDACYYTHKWCLWEYSSQIEQQTLWGKWFHWLFSLVDENYLYSRFIFFASQMKRFRSTVKFDSLVVWIGN